MKRTRVEIGKLVVHQPGLTPVHGAALGHMIEAHLGRLLMQGGGPSESQTIAAVQTKAGAGAHGGNIAGAVARALYRSIQSKPI